MGGSGEVMGRSGEVMRGSGGTSTGPWGRITENRNSFSYEKQLVRTTTTLRRKILLLNTMQKILRTEMKSM